MLEHATLPSVAQSLNYGTWMDSSNCSIWTSIIKVVHFYIISKRKNLYLQLWNHIDVNCKGALYVHTWWVDLQ